MPYTFMRSSVSRAQCLCQHTAKHHSSHKPQAQCVCFEHSRHELTRDCSDVTVVYCSDQKADVTSSFTLQITEPCINEEFCSLQNPFAPKSVPAVHRTDRTGFEYKQTYATFRWIIPVVWSQVLKYYIIQAKYNEIFIFMVKCQINYYMFRPYLIRPSSGQYSH